jgi:hypothetical protein
MVPFTLPSAPRQRLHVWALTVACAAILGCASTTGRSTGVRPSRDVILRDELARASATNAYEAVEKLRPQFLRGRGRASIMVQGTEAPGVIVDDRPYGRAAQLRDIDVRLVQEIRFISAAEAQQKYGMGFSGGAIVVTTLNHTAR